MMASYGLGSSDGCWEDAPWVGAGLSVRVDFLSRVSVFLRGQLGEPRFSVSLMFAEARLTAPLSPLDYPEIIYNHEALNLVQLMHVEAR